MLEIIKKIGKYGQYIYGYADESGNEVIEAQFDNAMPFVNGHAFVEDNTLWKVIDTEGRTISSELFGHIVWDAFSEGLYIASEPHDINKRGKCGFINQRGEWIIKPAYLRACPFKDGYAKVMTSSREWGFIKPDGTYLVPPVFEHAENFHHGYAQVKTAENARLFIQPDGSRILKSLDDENIVGVSFKYKNGYIDTDGRWHDSIPKS